MRRSCPHVNTETQITGCGTSSALFILESACRRGARFRERLPLIFCQPFCQQKIQNLMCDRLFPPDIPRLATGRKLLKMRDKNSQKSTHET
jgi:hypothetical protein